MVKKFLVTLCTVTTLFLVMEVKASPDFKERGKQVTICAVGAAAYILAPKIIYALSNGPVKPVIVEAAKFFVGGATILAVKELSRGADWLSCLGGLALGGVTGIVLGQ